VDTTSVPSSGSHVRTSVSHNFREYRQAVTASFVPLEVSRISNDPFWGRLRTVDVEPAHVSEVTASQHRVERTTTLLETAEPAYYKASLQVSGTGLTVVPSDAVRRDPIHLEERLASLCADSHQHPVADDSRLALAAAGAVASLEMTASLRRRAVLAAWFLSVGMLPPKMAMAVLSWKLDASSRPAFLTRLSKTIRNAMG